MCVIFTLEPGQNIEDDKLDKAVANNWHGYGVVLKDPSANRLEVRQNFSADKGADPEEVARILRDNDDVIRYVHLRHNTAGADGIENCHPFPVYSSDRRDIYLMHNGTLFDFKPKGDDQRSDTRIFTESVVSPLLVGFEGEFGKGDYNSPVIRTVLDKLIGGTNRVLLMSNDLDPLYCGNWIDVVQKDGSRIKASNAEYFYTIKRGPRHSNRPFQQAQSSGTSVVPFRGATGGACSKTMSTGTTSDTEQVQRSQTSQQEGASLVKEAKEARAEAITKLSEVENEVAPYEPPALLLNALGVTEKDFLQYGFDSIYWLEPQEISSAIRTISPVVLGELLVELAGGAMALSEELDVAEQNVHMSIGEIKILRDQLSTANARIIELERELQNHTSFAKVG